MPFLGVQGFMVTKFAATHNVESLAKDLVSNYMMQSGPQLELALANSRYPCEPHRRQAGQGPAAQGLRRGEHGRRPDAEHPADELRLG